MTYNYYSIDTITPNEINILTHIGTVLIFGIPSIAAVYATRLWLVPLIGKSTQIDPLNPFETDPLIPFQIDPLIPAEIDPLKIG